MAIAGDFSYFLRTIGACTDAREFVDSFDEDTPVDEVFNQLRMYNRDWLWWLIDKLHKSRVTGHTVELIFMSHPWVYTEEYLDMVRDTDTWSAELQNRYENTDMTSMEYYELLDEMYADRDERYADMWMRFKDSIRADLMAELESRV